MIAENTRCYALQRRSMDVSRAVDCPRCQAHRSLERVSLGYFFTNTTELFAEAPYSWLECAECNNVFTTEGKYVYASSSTIAREINAALSRLFDEEN